jgi:HlyD family secretion protein
MNSIRGNHYQLNKYQGKMKKRFIILIAVIAGLTVSAAFYFKKKEQDNPVLPETEHLQYGSISNSITATGTLQPVDTVAVGTQVSGTIKKIFADYNSIVKKGQLLAMLDRSLFNAQVEQYSSALQGATSQLAYQQQNLKRQTQLYQAGAISQSDYETAQNLFNEAKGSQGTVKAQLTSAEKNLSYASIYSPVDGTVLSRNISEGQTVAASFNTPTLFSIAKDLAKMQVRAAVDEADIGNVKAGQPVKFTVDAFPDDTFPGSVQAVRLEPVVTSNVVTYTTIIDAPNPAMKLKPGMTASIIIFIQQQNNAPLLSAKAINFNPSPLFVKKYSIIDATNKPGMIFLAGLQKQEEESKINTVWVLKDKQLIKKKILTGMNDDIHVEVLGGLDQDDQVVTGVQQADADRNKPVASRSPFMPSRRPTGGRN